MSYIVFARKYRPRDFDGVTGQSHITTTLKNAIEQSRVAHAYLFAGPRGVGKTTTARIFAKALNCEKGPTSKPCNKCPSCLEINSGSSLDIFEIDGASNRGIEEIRSLRENAKFTPSRGRFKVYIIDEVHMLSNEAFNALLKTLEEPPEHVKFIFATTHVHKVPPTILSRCQRFDFRRIPTRTIIENLKEISREEKLSISEDALGLIAKQGDGSMRDAQVMLDQIASFKEGRIGPKDVAAILGIVDDEILFGLSNAIHGKDTASGLKIIDSLVNDGKDVMQVALGLIEHFRNLSVAKACKDLDPLIDAARDKIERYRAEAGKFTIEEMLYVIFALSNTLDFMRKTDMARIPFEAAMVKLTLNTGIAPIAELSGKVAGLAKSPDSGVASAIGNGGPIIAAAAPEEDLTLGQDVESAKPGARTISLDDVLSSWAKVISYIRAKKISIASYLQEGDPINLEGNSLTIGFAKEFQFHKEVLETLENRRIIEEAIRETMGREVRAELVITELSGDGRRPGGGYDDLPGAVDGGSGEGRTDDADPIVKKALEMFGGKIAGNGNGRGRA